MGYRKASRSDIESVIPSEWGGMWFLREALGAEQLGFTVLELEPGGKGKRHDHDEDEQEEIYYVTKGKADVDLTGETITLEAGEALRLDASETRRIHNRTGERAELVLVGAS